MKIRLFYTNGEYDDAKGLRAKALLRPMLKDAGFSLDEALALKPCEWSHRDGTTLDCKAYPGQGIMLDCYDEGSGCRWDRFSVLFK